MIDERMPDAPAFVEEISAEHPLRPEEC